MVIGIVLLIIAFSQSSSTEFSVTAGNFVNSSSRQTDTAVSSAITEKSYTYYESREGSDDSGDDETEPVVSYPLNINTCTMAELMTIDGIGESKADAIIQYREYLGGYTSVEQIKNIKGIGDVIFEKISPYLTV